MWFTWPLTRWANASRDLIFDAGFKVVRLDAEGLELQKDRDGAKLGLIPDIATKWKPDTQ